MRKMKLIGKRALGLLVGGLLTLMVGSCALAAEAASIQSFTASSTVVQSGETVQLNWVVSGAAEVKIIGIEKETEQLPLNGSLEVWPMATTAYVLEATGLDGVVVSKSLTVNVDTTGKVKIKDFSVSATRISPGQTVTLSWKVNNAVSVKIVGIAREDEIIRPITGSTEVWPETTTTYILLATGSNGEVASVAITVNVLTAVEPKIVSFTASQTEVSKGTKVTLAWSTENVVSCTIVASSGAKLKNRKPNGSISLTTKTTEDFTLIAYGADGAETTSTLTIKVN